MYSFAIFVFFTVLITNPGEALRCYECDPKEMKEACNDPFNTTFSKIAYCGEEQGVVCTKLVARSTFNMSEMSVGRGCSNLGSQTCNKYRDGLTTHGSSLSFCKTCDTDLCNHAAPTLRTSVIVISLAVALSAIRSYNIPH